MTHTEAALKERIKELTCLYEVSSIIVNADLDQISETLSAISHSLKRAFQHSDQTSISITTTLGSYATDDMAYRKEIESVINVFNENAGHIKASLNEKNFIFLEEEQQLLNAVALKIGSLLERLEIQRNETSLKRQMEHADRLNILGELTAGIAHELNTPLANILGFAELLLQDDSLSADSISDIDKIIKNAIFSREVVKKLMFFACEMPQEMQSIDVVTSIKDAVNLLEASFKKAQIKCLTELPDHEIIIKADRIQFTQIIFNLAINAIYFSAPHSTVTISAAEKKDSVHLKVSDQGSGLTMATAEKLFQPFYTTKPTGDGAGLGLSVVHGIVTSHRGSITAENNNKSGTTFTIKLPKK
jgi:signal transduction histidine kinase